MRIILCLPGNNFSGNFLDCFGETLHHFITKGYKVAVSRKEGSNVHHVRTMVLAAAATRGRVQKPFDGQADYDWLIWIDSDIVWNPEHIEELLKTEGDIVSGLYRMADGKCFTAVQNWDIEFYKKNGYFPFITPQDLELEKYKKPFSVEYVGMGFMAVRYGVFERIEYPWFSECPLDLGDGIIESMSEDVAFCRKAKKQGFQITINPKVIVGHEKRFIV